MCIRDRVSPDPILRDTIKSAKMLEGNFRNTGVHACGTIICRDDIPDWVPVSTADDKDTGEKMLVTQYEGSVIEDTGLILSLIHIYSNQPLGYYYARILYVLPNSPASSAGLERGDWICLLYTSGVEPAHWLASRYWLNTTRRSNSLARTSVHCEKSATAPCVHS